MKPLRDWSGRRVAAVALVWLLGLPTLVAPAVFGAVGWLARAERERDVAPVADSLAPALRGVLPPQADDFAIVFAGPGAMLLLGFFLLPPLVLVLAWIVARRRRSNQLTQDVRRAS